MVVDISLNFIIRVTNERLKVIYLTVVNAGSCSHLPIIKLALQKEKLAE